MPIPRLGQNKQPPTQEEVNEWNKMSRMEKLRYWQGQLTIHFIHAFRFALTNSAYSGVFTWKLTRIQRKANSHHVSLPSGEQYFQRAILDSLNVLAKNFQPLSNAIHTTGSPFTQENIMYAAEVCVVNNPEDEKYWKFAAQLIEKKVLEPI
jgi:hypothetical protein